MKYILIVFQLIVFICYVQAQCDPNASQANGGACQCNQGYYGQDASSNGKCNQCPTGSTSQQGQANSDASYCNQCLVNYYMATQAVQPTNGNTAAAASCLPCPQGTGNQAGPTVQGDVSQCTICLINYYMTQAAVPANKANQTPASAATCTACPTGSGNKSGPTIPGDISQCDYCLDNYFMTQNAYGPSNLANNQFASAAQCSACPANSYIKSSNQISFCKCYDINALPLTPSNIQCTCKRGWQGKVSGSSSAPSGCSQCPPGQFSMNGFPCKQCGPGSYINDDQGSCTCYDTSNGTNPWNFSTNVCQCQFNFYGDPSKATKITSGSCSPCPDGTSSPNGSVASSQCKSNSSDNSNSNQQGTQSSTILYLSLSLFSLFILL
ncbi:immobilization antigen (macronuclear) [Tetrahymena thermophila SB210]|uniref:Immobilization antigen n=1 Tax=Tetrahymena thermophila (strain SB210) TaxID=312017 RepID=Q23QE5_TETTS|nr:immobilization antigen [Tetrahymena thermophila SB210]EAR98752.3 immobilization antigen [Tetrahymena thermophila SB210]|eukprot:XP_001018997.3 immobilization antigen [Tetrahymena thermophila SB210]